MKIFSLMAAIMTAGLCSANTTTEPEAPVATATGETTAMAKAIESTDFITPHKPSTEAKYYMYLCTAYWCAPCRKELPHLIAEYEEMKKDNHVEVIVLSLDHHVSGALRYMELFDAPFAAVMYKGEQRKQLPGAPDDIVGIPHIYVVDANGNFIHRGHASTYKNWRQFTKKD